MKPFPSRMMTSGPSAETEFSTGRRLEVAVRGMMMAADTISQEGLAQKNVEARDRARIVLVEGVRA